MLMQKIQRFMMGRYGGDPLNLGLLVLGLVCSVCARLCFWPLILLADGIFVYALFRSLSRNIPARQRENQAFMRVWGPAAGWFRLQSQKLRQRKTYKYFKCPHCRQQLRAPRGRGNIEVTCQKCGTVFRTKS